MPEQDAWNQARDLLLRWEALTGKLEANLASEPAGDLLLLLKERRRLCDRLDSLKKKCGLADWSGRPVKDRPTAAQEEIGTIHRRLIIKNEQVCNEIEERMSSLKQKISEIRQTRTANRLYQGRRRSIKGAFIDTMR
jgi:hypothetical protein